jgi:peptide/nickel transport system permease protein
VTVVRLTIGRLLSAVVTLLLVSIIIFAAVEVLPGDVASRVLGRNATEESLAALRDKMNLNASGVERYLDWLGGVVEGDFGASLTSNRPITTILGNRVTNTLILSGVAFLLYIPLALIPAMIQAIRRDRPIDHGLSVVTLVLLSTPDFLLATLLLIVFVVFIPILPAISMVGDTTTLAGWAEALVLPSVTLAIVMAVYAVRMLRDNLIEVLDSEYIRMAELKGMPARRVLLRHALPNALVPTLNITALNLGYLIGGVVIVERVFSFPGFGSLLIDSIQILDIPVIEATILLAASVYIAANLLADIGAILLNPRLRKS